MLPFNSRRDFLKQTALGGVGLCVAAHWWPTLSHSQSPPADTIAGLPAVNPDNLLRSNIAPRMLQEYYVEKLRKIDKLRTSRIEGIKTRAEAEGYVTEVREKIRKCFGPFPEKTPLNARVTGRVDRDGYSIEKILFESRPGFLVTGNLYVPRNRPQPLPGVIGTCGHSPNGKAAEPYQSFAQGLARLGYVVLIYDPIGQGERIQYLTPDLKSSVGVGVLEHLLAGNQQSLIGEFLGSWRAWDGIRALDYLLSRPEVDPTRIGVTGNSGGGTLTTWLCGLEERFTMAAPSCFVTSFRNNLENELPADTEQCPPQALALGLDHEDFLAALAPKPIVILTQEKDYFDVRGSERALGRLKHLYGLLGHAENISLFTGPQGHGYSVENRTAMYQWFNSHANGAEVLGEPPLTIEKDETLYCTPQGQVGPLGSIPIHQFTRETSRQLKKTRPQYSPESLVKTVEMFLDLPERKGVPEYRILRAISNRGYPLKSAAVYAIETEPGIQAFTFRISDEARYSRPPRDAQPALLYVPHQSSDGELRNSEFLRKHLRADPKQETLYAVDVRGVGESRPNTCGTGPFTPYGADFFYAAHGLMLGRPVVAQRTFDLLRVLDWLEAHGHTRIRLVAEGWGTVPAAFAALLHPAVTALHLHNALGSYAEPAESENYDWPLSSFLPGVLKQFDLPDLYAAIQSRGEFSMTTTSVRRPLVDEKNQ